MKDSNLKIILPIILIPTFVVILIIVAILKIKSDIKNDFKNSISDKKIIKYLEKKYDGEFSDVKLITHQKSAYQR